MLKKLWRKWGPNPLDRRLKRAAKRKIQNILITWNRGMGDVPLGMYALLYRIRQFLSEVKIAFLVRGGLKDAFSLLEGVDKIYTAEHWKRGAAFDLEETLQELNLDSLSFDMILENPDPTQWLKWQLGNLVPQLKWNKEHDALAASFGLQGKRYIGLHIHTETMYGYEKNWPFNLWKELSERLIREKGVEILLFGLKASSDLSLEKVIDLRGKTSLFEMLSIIKNHCSHLVAPDSGVLSLIYYLNVSFPLHIVSLWADPRQGILKQNVDSPNPELTHIPILGKEEKVENIPLEEVVQALAIDISDPLLKRQREALFQPKNIVECTPLKEWMIPPERSQGFSLLAEGRVGCLVLAGGQGTRLGMTLPKGMALVSPLKRKSLFQMLCEKTHAASIFAGRPLPLAIMTSPLNHSITVDNMEKHQRFGLEEGQIFYFTQKMLPFLDDKGHWLLGAGGKIAEGPDGNGYALARFYESGIWQEWKERGIEYVNVILIDNPLADPFDPALIAAHIEARADVTLKCVPRLHHEEKVGVVGLDQHGRLRVIEYSDLSEEQKTLDWKAANISLFCFHMDFIKKVSPISLPWHLARKGGLWKFETFIFDLLDHAEHANVVLYPREKAYAPLKNAIGEASFETVRAQLLAADKKIYEEITGLIAPETPFELDPAFYYPTATLLETWKGKELPIL